MFHCFCKVLFKHVILLPLLFIVVFNKDLSPPVVQQFYQTRVNDEFILRGNTGTLKCLVPSFVADFVQVVEWISDDANNYSAQMSSDVLNYGMEHENPHIP